MTDLSTDKLEALLAEIPEGPWTRLFGMAEATVCPTDAYDAFMRPGSTQNRILRIIHDGDPRDPISVYIAEAIALVPALLREVLDRREAEDWQNISTAPKDGAQILLHGLLHQPSIDAGIPETVIGHWTDHNGGGWVWYGSLAITFTHWRPLPATPTDGGHNG